MLIIERKSVDEKELKEVLINLMIDDFKLMMDEIKKLCYDDDAKEVFNGKE